MNSTISNHDEVIWNIIFIPLYYEDNDIPSSKKRKFDEI